MPDPKPMELAIDSAAFRELAEAQVPSLTDYSIGFALPTVEEGFLEASVGGSGTLVMIDDVQGILTAAHVVESLARHRYVGLILPSTSETKSHPHHPTLHLKYCHQITFPPPEKLADGPNGPDLALLIPPPNVLAVLRASKVFYNLSKRQEMMLERPPPIDLGFWTLSGLAAEWTIDMPPEKGFAKIKGFKGFHGVGKLTNEYEKGEYDYLTFETLYNDAYEGPSRYGGFSGGALWQQIVRPDGTGFKVANRLLTGVVFYESRLIENAGQTTREITGHGRKSLYRSLIDAVRARHAG